jgi:hypothetical protein
MRTSTLAKKPPLSPGYEGRRELSVERVRDPWPHPDKPLATIEVIVNIKESPVEWMYRRGKIDETTKLAADRFRAIYERAEVGSAPGVDYQRPKVDGGQIARAGVTDAVADAHKQLASIRRALGGRLYSYLCMIAGEGLSVRAVAVRIDGKGLRLTREGVAYSFRDALADLVEHFGVTRGTIKQPIRAETAIPKTLPKTLPKCD